MKDKRHIVKIGRPGRFDQIFGLRKTEHHLLCDPLWEIVFLDDGERVKNIGAFFDPISAENYVYSHREELINDKFEEEFLT
jgi:hypothetical protein